MKLLDWIARILLILGGVNWGLIGVADFNIIMWVFIAMPMVQHAFYILFGLAALWTILRSIARCFR